MTKKIYTVYITRNLKNGKFYIGMHATMNVNDEYLGSGLLLKKAIRKYGKESFRKEVLFVFDNELEMIEKEKELLSESMTESKNCYNLCGGGIGGNKIRVRNHPTHSLEHLRRMNEIQALKYKTDPDFNRSCRDGRRERLKKTHREGKISYSTFAGRTHSEETIAKMRKAKKGFGVGAVNSQFGTMWITNGKENKKIKKDEVVPEGFKLGRKIRK